MGRRRMSASQRAIRSSTRSMRRHRPGSSRSHPILRALPLCNRNSEVSLSKNLLKGKEQVMQASPALCILVVLLTGKQRQFLIRLGDAVSEVEFACQGSSLLKMCAGFIELPLFVCDIAAREQSTHQVALQIHFLAKLLGLLAILQRLRHIAALDVDIAE